METYGGDIDSLDPDSAQEEITTTLDGLMDGFKL